MWTVVNGDAVRMSRGDFLPQAGWNWHAHHNAATEPMAWIDGLDIPFAYQNDVGFFEFGSERVTDYATPNFSRGERLWAHPGLRPLSSALDAEGFDDLGSGQLVESFARHLMVATDAWQEKGFGEIAKGYLARLAPAASGVRRELVENGDLLLRRMTVAEPERRALMQSLAQAPSWLDPATGGPK